MDYEIQNLSRKKRFRFCYDFLPDPMNPNQEKLFAKVAVPKPIRKEFWYHCDATAVDKLQAGSRVLVPFRNQTLVGYLVGIEKSCDVKTRLISAFLDEEPIISEPLLRLTEWASQYYFCSWGEMIHSVLPFSDVRFERWVETSPKIVGENGQSGLEKIVLEYLIGSGPVRLEELAKFFNLTPAQIRREFTSFKSPKQIKIMERPRRVSGRPSEKSYVETHFETKDQKATPDREPELTLKQKEIVETISPSIHSEQFEVFCLHGLTGSGKTEIYLQLVRQAIDTGKGAIVLVPEISLTYQLLRRFYHRFGNRVGVLHSGLTPKERRDEWQRIHHGKATVAIGARSAVFAPVHNLGLIVVDEEYDGSYKQNETPRYNGRDVAIKRGSLEKTPVVLGAATPSLETYYHCESKKYQYLSLMERIDHRPMPEVTILDLREKEEEVDLQGPFTLQLLDEIQKRLRKKEQVLVFLNRRGTASYVQCKQCGHVPECRNCSISLTYHQPRKMLLCHYCGYSQNAPETCPTCSGTRFRCGATGTQKLEEMLQTEFPDSKVVRLDRDTNSTRGAHMKILKEVEDRLVDILVGTQMVAKGHDFSGITLVGVVSADDSLNIPDFRSSEKTFQLITQVAGRSGRGDLPGSVLLQTFHPGHHSIEASREHDFLQFYKDEIVFRKVAEYPPFFRLVLFHIEGTNEKRVESFAGQIKNLADSMGVEKKGIRVVGPAPAFINKVKNRFRWRILLKGTKVGPLHQAVNHILNTVESGGRFKRSGIRFMADADPIYLL